MSLNPLNELKRRLENTTTPLPKRICLAKNVIQSHHFPSAPKERVVGSWLQALTLSNGLPRDELRNVLEWLNSDLTGEMKSMLIQIVAQYIQSNPITNNDIPFILQFLENHKITPQLNQHINEYLKITITLLLCLKQEELNTSLVRQLLNNVTKYYRECKKKLEFILKLLSEDHLETLFSYLDTECEKDVIELCRHVLFPITRKSYYISYLQTLIRRDNLDELIAEKGDNIQSVLKIMSALFDAPQNGRDSKFIKDFISVFVGCFHSESQVIFAFYIMLANFLDMPQSFIKPAMSLNTIKFEGNEDKIKRGLFLDMLEILLRNEVDISIRLTDTFGEKISKVEIKKNFMSFLQAVMMGQLKLEGKPDKITMNIIKIALKLDPTLIEQKLTEILPPIMTAKKYGTSKNYVEMINCLLEMLFKLSRGTPFLSQILPYIKNDLEACNTEQFELRQSVAVCRENGTDYGEYLGKIINGSDIFPDECVENYGKYTSELMFRQNKDVLELLQKDFEEHCLMMLEEGFVSPSIITLAEILSAILCSFLRYNKMADHTVPYQISQDFWSAYDKFEKECLKRFGECVLKLSYNPSLHLSFLKLCLSVAQLKVLNIKYSNCKLDIKYCNSETFDMSFLLPCLTGEQWLKIASKIVDDEAVLVMDELLLVKSMASELLNNQKYTISIKTHLVSEFTEKIDSMIIDKAIPQVLYYNLTKSQYKQLAKSLVKYYNNIIETQIFDDENISNNRVLLNYLTIETVKQITKCFDNSESLTKSITKIDFLDTFCKGIDMKEYFSNITISNENFDAIKNYIELLKHLNVAYLEENYQLVVIFVLLAIKKCGGKKIKKTADSLLQNIFELSYQPPDLYKLFPVDFVFSFSDKTMIDLLTLTNKTSNNSVVIKNILESSVKRVRTDSDIVKKIVELIIKNKTKAKGIECFKSSAFQINCLILPLIVKQKKAITASAYRSILADLQEKLHKELLKGFKNIDFGSNFANESGNTEDLVEYNMATLNAMAAYSLTLSKYCEATNQDEIKDMECVLSGLEFFVEKAITTIEETTSKPQQVESSLQLLIVILRHIKKLETQNIFKEKDKLLLKIWRSIKCRLLVEFGKKNSSFSEELSATLKFVCELMSVESFVANFVGDLMNLSVLKKPAIILKDKNDNVITSNQVAKFVWTQCLKANIVGPKCVALTKIMYRSCKNLRFWMRQHHEWSVANKRKKIGIYPEENIVRIEDKICDIVKLNLDMVSEVVLSAKKMSLDYKFLDNVFSLLHIVSAIMYSNSIDIKYEITWRSYFELFEGCLAVLNSLLISREEMIEDRWPNYMQCYRTLMSCVCSRSSLEIEQDRTVEDKMAETAHDIEKLTQSISKRKKHVSRVAAYTVADICTFLEKSSPSRPVRQHLENSVALLIQASDSNYAMAFLKRALAGSPGQMTMTNLYTMYKRYHKYVGNA